MRTKILFIMIILSIVLGACTLTRGQEWGDDFASYVLQAESILNGTTAEFIETSAFTNTEFDNLCGSPCLSLGVSADIGSCLCTEGHQSPCFKNPNFGFLRGIFGMSVFVIKGPFHRGRKSIDRWLVRIQSPAPPIP